MTSISSSGSPIMETWMVDLLFASPNQDQSTTQASHATSTPSLTVTPRPSSSVSSRTAQAVLALQAGGSDAASSNPSPDSDTSSQQASITQDNAMFQANYSMTSSEVNVAMYGKGVPALGYVDGRTTGFADIQNNVLNYLNFYDERSTNTALSDADRQEAVKLSADAQTFLHGITAAYKDHTLIFQNATEVQGLDFTQTISLKGISPDKPPNVVVGTETYNRTFYLARNSDGKNHRLVDTGAGLGIYLTW